MSPKPKKLVRSVSACAMPKLPRPPWRPPKFHFGRFWEAKMAPKTAFLASKMHVVCPRAISHRFRWPLDPILIDFQSLQTSKIIEGTKDNKGFCYIALFHFGSVWDPQNPSILASRSHQNALQGLQNGSQMASKTLPRSNLTSRASKPQKS